jgi:hypothetical protein
MNYCSIEDAWGTINYASNQYKEYVNNNLENNIEHFDKNVDSDPTSFESIDSSQAKLINQPREKLNKMVNIYNLDNKIDELNNCDSFILHARNCRKCYNKMKNQFKPQLIEKFQDMIEENRDTIVLILIGISILLFFNLINNITKN